MSISENLDILYRLGKYNKLVYIANKEIWNHKLNNAKYLIYHNNMNIADTRNFLKILRKVRKIWTDPISQKSCLDFLTSVYILENLRIEKLKMDFPKEDVNLEKYLEFIDNMKIVLYGGGEIRTIYDKCRSIKHSGKLSLIVINPTTNIPSISALKNIVKKIKIKTSRYHDLKTLVTLEKTRIPISFSEYYSLLCLNENKNDVLTIRARSRTIEITEEDEIFDPNGKLFNSILSTTEELVVKYYMPDPSDPSIRDIDVVLQKIKHNGPKLVIFAIVNDIDTCEKYIMSKYSHLRTNIAVISYKKLRANPL